jgi:alkylation response protein AidB-like acyl-CoA dehydrogenase
MVAPAAGSRVSSGEPSAATIEAITIRLAKKSARFGKTASDDPVIRDRIMQIAIRQTGFSQTNRRGGVKGLVDHPMRIPMQVKLVASEIGQDRAALSVDIEGASSTFNIGDKNAPDGGVWPHHYLNSYGGTIAQGTSEIQRNQLGERVLGMPKSK